MSFSRARYEAAIEVVDLAGVRRDEVSGDCLTCPATKRMAASTMATGRGPEIDGAQEVARGYLKVIAGCTGAEACKGVEFSPPPEAEAFFGQ